MNLTISVQKELHVLGKYNIIIIIIMRNDNLYIIMF